MLFQVKVDRKKIRFPKLKFKGAFHPTVIRKTPDEKNEEGEVKGNGDAPVEEEKSSSPPTPSVVVGSIVKEPKYNVKYRHASNLEDPAVYQVLNVKIETSWFHFKSFLLFVIISF